MTQRSLLLALFAPLALVTTGCAQSDANCSPETPVVAGMPPMLGSDCDPLVPTQCGFPFPSNVFSVEDPTTTTGRRVLFGPKTLPQRVNGNHVNPDAWKDSDGFSPGQTILTHLPGATTTGLPTQDTIDASITTASPTILMEADSGQLIPHFAEIDESVLDPDEDRTFMIRPVVRLKDATRYIVAIRHVVNASGKPIPPTEAFRALRDNEPACVGGVDTRRDLYGEIFGKLQKAGISRTDLQIAWDYTTASRENNTQWLVHMRDDALAAVGQLGPEYTIVEYTDDPNPNIRRRILGKMKVPLYLDKPDPGGKLVFGDDGMPKQNGTAEFEFLVQIPHAALNGTPGAILQNGHGLLGRKTEGQDGYLADLANKKNFVTVAVDLIGMANDDFDTIANTIVGDAGDFRYVVDRQHQGLVNSLLAMRLMKTRFVNEPLVMIGPGNTSVIDPMQCYYRGDSQGGIFGTTYMAISTDVTRGLLGEPGMPYSLLLNRSSDFGPYFTLLRSAYPAGRDIQMLIGLLQMTWDRTEPDGYAPYIVANTLPNTPAHNVLLHVAIGDHQVTPLGAHIIARTTKAKNLLPVNRSVWGIEEAQSSFQGSGMVEFDFGIPEAPKTNQPPTQGDDPHDAVRILDVAHDQTDTFLRSGVIQGYCTGACDPM